MVTRKQHRLLGSIMLLPFIAWSLTGIFFLVRPAYEAAYAPLSPRTYAADTVTIEAAPDWQEVRLLKTVLGQHILIKQSGIWRQLDPDTLEARATPTQDELRALVNDAIALYPERYGELLLEGAAPLRTTTGVTISVDWDALSLHQQGTDTRWIDRIYSIHYLQWTGIPALDTVLGVGGLILLLLVTLTGLLMLLRSSD